jgi:GrpB-like predicted nucleotidyltransferase (UPF0157 family)
MRTVTVVDYDAAWPARFERLRATVWPVVADLAVSIEHVGSTSVPGLAAKPVIDLDVVVRSGRTCRRPSGASRRWGTTTWATSASSAARRSGRRKGRRRTTSTCADRQPEPGEPPRAARPPARHPELAHAYGALKKRLAQAFPHDIDGYVAAKTDFIVGVLRAAGMPEDHLKDIERANRR